MRNNDFTLGYLPGSDMCVKKTTLLIWLVLVIAGFFGSGNTAIAQVPPPPDPNPSFNPTYIEDADQDTIGYAQVNGDDDNIRFLTEGQERMTISEDGNIGIGTTDPAFPLSISGEYAGIMMMYLPAQLYFGVQGGGVFAFSSSYGDALKITQNGNVGIGQYLWPVQAKLEVLGNIRVSNSNGPVVELGEGLDLAECFETVENSKLQPGDIVIIDPENTKKLKICTKEYDRRIAGIVSGANKLGCGLLLGKALMDKESHQPIALKGRVYCNVDTSEYAIDAGDLLTTSNVPGHAMKVIDYQKAKGAIIGKALGNMKMGSKGKVLVLVSLQ